MIEPKVGDTVKLDRNQQQWEIDNLPYLGVVLEVFRMNIPPLRGQIYGLIIKPTDSESMAVPYKFYSVVGRKKIKFFGGEYL